MITQERLKYLVYEKDGSFYWRNPPHPRFKAHNKVGFLKRGFYSVKLDAKEYQIHRLMFLYMIGNYPKELIIFKDNNKLNTKYDNLEIIPKGVNQDILKKLLHYDKDTGKFFWKYDFKNCIKGKEAGTYNKQYVGMTVNECRKCAHQFAFLYMRGYIPKEIDHIDRNRFNNAWVNLREITSSDNNVNISLRNNNTSGVTGVSFDKKSGTWRSYINYHNKRIEFEKTYNFIDAVKKRYKAEIKYGFNKIRKDRSEAYICLKDYYGK